MEKKFIEVLEPTVNPTEMQTDFVGFSTNLDGKVVGFVDNRKPNFDIFLSRFEELLSKKFQLSDIIRVRKGHTDQNAALSAGEIKNLAAKCDIVFNGICD